jgi:hypothetical protein
LALDVLKHLHNHEFTALEKSEAYGTKGWPAWHYGVISQYASQIALNGCARDNHNTHVEKSPSMLEFTSSSTEAVTHHAHLHTAHNADRFNKNAFLDGAYDNYTVADLDLNIVRDFALSMAIQGTGRVPRTPESDRQDLDKAFIRAAVVFLPTKTPHFVRQLRWFHRSWQEMQKYEPQLWRTDILVYTNGNTTNDGASTQELPMELRFLKDLNCSMIGRKRYDEPNKCVVIPNMTTLRTATFNYGYADSINVLTVALSPIYDWVLRTDLDTFLTPAFSTWKPTRVSVGRGAYIIDNTDTEERLLRISEKLHLHAQKMTNIGSTWYGPATLLQECAKQTVEIMKYLHSEEFTEEEKSVEYGVKGWPRWHYGVLTMYGGHLAMNNCTHAIGMEKRIDMLDVPSHTKESPWKHAHLHTWQDHLRFSKFDFEDGIHIYIYIYTYKFEWCRGIEVLFVIDPSFD